MVIRDILLMHHSHFDLGYTHPQPVLWELSRRFIDGAIELCERTADRDDASQLRWTCEVTAPVLHWLRHASDGHIDRLHRLLQSGHISFGAMQYHLTPLCDATLLCESLAPMRELRQRFGIELATAVQHDINGLPWPLTQVLLDAGIDLLLMGVNLHYGGLPIRQPLAFHWQGSDGRLLLVFNGEHYGSFQRMTALREGTMEAMANGLSAYLQQLQAKDYPYDFAFLTVTHPVKGDNNPPYPPVVELVRQWNAEGRAPIIRFATPEMLRARLREQPAETIPTYAGDWTDYWNFGAGSTARETRIAREAAARLATADLLASATGYRESRLREIRDEAMSRLLLYCEHTWGPYGGDLRYPEHDNVRSQIGRKQGYAYDARDLTNWLLREELDLLAENPRSGEGVTGILLVNPAPVARTAMVRIPESWLTGAWRHDASRLHGIEVERETWAEGGAQFAGPFDLPPCSVLSVPVEALPEMKAPSVLVDATVIESPFHRLAYDQNTVDITSLVDKQQGWEVVDPNSSWPLFSCLREILDTTRHSAVPPLYGRDAYFDFARLRENRTGWRGEWPALYQRPTLRECRVESDGPCATLISRWDADGTEGIEQRITLCSYRPTIEVEVRLAKRAERLPEAWYVAFPCALGSWRAHFDTAGLPVAYDREQLPGVCRDWVTVDRWVTLEDGVHGVTLACPDAPLVQIGRLNFGRGLQHADPGAPAVIFAWPMNNYWNTNFPTAQSGELRFRYEFTTHGAYDPQASSALGAEACCSVEVHPIAGEYRTVDHRLVEVTGARLVTAKPSGDGLLLRLLNVTSESVTANIRLPGRSILTAAVASTLDEPVQPLPVTAGGVILAMPPRSLHSVILGMTVSP